MLLRHDADAYTTEDLVFYWRTDAKPIEVNDKIELPEYILTNVTHVICSQNINSTGARYHCLGLTKCLLLRSNMPRVYGSAASVMCVCQRPHWYKSINVIGCFLLQRVFRGSIYCLASAFSFPVGRQCTVAGSWCAYYYVPIAKKKNYN